MKSREGRQTDKINKAWPPGPEADRVTGAHKKSKKERSQNATWAEEKQEKQCMGPNTERPTENEERKGGEEAEEKRGPQQNKQSKQISIATAWK